MDLLNFLYILDQIAPLKLASEWDKAGLQIEPLSTSTIKTVLITLDLTDEVLDEAISKQADFILAYHPLLFEPVPRLTQDDRIARISMRCIQHNITVYSPHTALDAVSGGMTDWLTRAAGEGKTTIIEPYAEDHNHGHGRVLTLDAPASLKDIAQHLKNSLQLPYLRIAQGNAQAEPVRRIVVCPGAGASLLLGQEADVLITGEMRHHDLLTATGSGKSVILLEHALSERGFLNVYKEKIEATISDGSLSLLLSESDSGPLALYA